MLQLDSPLAQSIVDRAMQIIDCNVNVMDHRGIIIASGDSTRIGSHHEGALLVLAQSRTVEIDEALARRLHDARPGINLPLHAEGRVVGVVGLTGEPERIRQYAELLRMAAETMLEQARLMQLLARDMRLREELVLQSIGEVAASPALDDWAQRLGVDLDMPRIAVVLEFDSKLLDVDAALNAQQRLHARLAAMDRNNLIASLSVGESVMLTPTFDSRGVWSTAVQREKAYALHQRLTEGMDIGLRIALGGYFAGAEGRLQSFRSARSTMRIGKKREPHAKVHYYADLTLPVLLAGLGESWQADQLRNPLERLSQHDRQGQLRHTLEVWFAHHMKRTATTNALHLHRNTLNYRLERVAELTGLDLGRLEDCLLLYIGLQMLDHSPT